MLRPIACAAVLLAAGASGSTPAPPELVRHPSGMTGANGHCDSLVVGGAAVVCGDTVISIRYDDGRRSIAVKAADGLVSFFGKPDDDGITISLITGVRQDDTADRPSIASQPAVGRCTPAAIAASTQIRCRAAAPDGSISALSFTTDEKPPFGTEFPK